MFPEVLLYIGGTWCRGSSGKSIPVVNPATGDEIGAAAHAERPDLDQALDAADAGFRTWRNVSAFERYRIMRRSAEILRSRADAIARILTLEQGKPIGEATADTLSGVDIIEWFGEEGRRAYGRIIPPRADGILQTVTKEPIGPVAAFTPWNFPTRHMCRIAQIADMRILAHRRAGRGPWGEGAGGGESSERRSRWLMTFAKPVVFLGARP